MRLNTLIVAVLLFTGCTAVKDFTIKDARSAEARAARHGDQAGEGCWRHIATRMESEAIDGDVVGLMDAVEVARILRLRSAANRTLLTAACAEVFSDILVEIARRGR